ncbi:MAG TPA: sigma-54 dependent transcriptional regulator [Thermoanaerobaculia bacterium]|jgi:two-component system nitrogen regulation response regulator GlnG|nr:sigma-54 dependent transcriptional regulator [Thermoanaerobaculia bacterium]
MPTDSEALRPLHQDDTRGASDSVSAAHAQLTPGLTILYHPDVSRIGERVPLRGLMSGQEERLSRGEPAFCQPGNAPRSPFPLADIHVSRRPIRFVPGPDPGGIRLICGECGSAVVVNGETVAEERRLTAAEIDRGAVLLLASRVVVLLSRIDPAAPRPPEFGLVGESATMIFLRQEIDRVAALNVPVLLRGETGTGKELVARACHDAGPRRDRPYLAVNMAAIPPTLAAAELFGAARGAYTGADRKRDGYFQRADGGTLFLDEVADTPLEVQALLLRALETREIQPVGGGAPVRLDIRLIAATDADLEGAVATGRFRAPLLHRLAGYEIQIPPLRARRDDFGRLFLHFLRQELEQLGEGHRLVAGAGGRPWIPAALVARLAAFDWPGNVRQLRNFVRQIVLAGRDGKRGMWLQAERLFQDAQRPGVRPERAPARLPATETPTPVAKEPRKVYRSSDDVTEHELLKALRANRWRIQKAAAQLGISRTSLYERIEKSSKIRKGVDLSRQEIEACHERCGGDLDAMVEVLEVSKRGLQRRMSQLGLARWRPHGSGEVSAPAADTSPT